MFYTFIEVHSVNILAECRVKIDSIESDFEDMHARQIFAKLSNDISILQDGLTIVNVDFLLIFILLFTFVMTADSSELCLWRK